MCNMRNIIYNMCNMQLPDEIKSVNSEGISMFCLLFSSVNLPLILLSSRLIPLPLYITSLALFVCMLCIMY